jgi:ABC-2 type transport system ATP-binding protein
MSEPLIELRHARKTFRTRQGRINALVDVNLAVQEGDVFGLLGANGAGKTTAMRGILGLTRLDAGAVRLAGRERVDRRSFFRQAAYLPEEPQFYQGATGREHLLYFGRLCELTGARLRGRVDESLAVVGLSDAADRPIAGYSKGMKQRLGVAAAILHEPRIVFLDEPTRGLDPLARREVRDLLQSLAARGATLFLNSHLLSEVERLCNRVAILDRGEVRVQGLLSELLVESEHIDVQFALPPGVDPAAFGPATAAEKGTWKAIVADTAALADLAGRLARAGGRVIAARAARVDLEDYLVRVVKENELA